MAMTEGSGTSMTVDLAQQILEGLSSISLGLEMDGVTASSFSVLQGVADALLLRLSAGERPAEVASEQLQLRVQRDSLAEVGGTSDRLLESPVTTPGDTPTTLWLPAALHQSLQTQAGEEVATRLLVIRHDPHSNSSDLASWQNSTVCDDVWCHRVASAITSVSLLYANGTEVTVTDLEDPIIMNLTVAGTPEHEQSGVNLNSTMTAANLSPLRCAFWDATAMHYSSYGCVNLPNPAPRNATLYWRNQTVWGKPDTNMKNSTWLFTQNQYWGIRHPWLLDGCDQRDMTTEDLMASNGTTDHITETGMDANAICAVLSSNNSAGCTWSEVLQGFVGPGCEWSDVLDCRCTHLTDFVVDMPDKVEPVIVSNVPPPPFPIQPPPPPLPPPPQPPHLPPPVAPPTNDTTNGGAQITLSPPITYPPLPHSHPPTTSPTSSGADEDIEHLVDSPKTESGTHNDPDAPTPVEESEQSSDDEAKENEGEKSESGRSSGREAGSMLHKYAVHVSVTSSVLLVLSCMAFVVSRHLECSSKATDHTICDTIWEEPRSTPSFAHQLDGDVWAVSGRTLGHEPSMDADSRYRLVSADVNIDHVGNDEMGGNVVPASLPAPIMGASVEHSPYPAPWTCSLPRTFSRESLQQGAEVEAKASSSQCTLPRSSDVDVCVVEEVTKPSQLRSEVQADGAQHVEAVGIEMPVDAWAGAMNFDEFSDTESHVSGFMGSLGEAY
eukprot:gene3599-4528_t